MAENPGNIEEKKEEPKIVGEIVQDTEKKSASVERRVVRVPKAAAEVGETLVSKSGTRRKVLDWKLIRDAPGGGVLKVETTKIVDGTIQTFTEELSFEEIARAKAKGAMASEKSLIDVEEFANRKKAEILANEERKNKTREADTIKEKSESPSAIAESLRNATDEEKLSYILKNAPGNLGEKDELPAKPASESKLIAVEEKAQPEAKKKSVKPKKVSKKSLTDSQIPAVEDKKSDEEIPVAQFRPDEKSKSSDLEELLANPEFRGFLEGQTSKGEEEFGVKSAKELKELFEVFQEKEVVEKNLAELYKNELGPALGVEIGKEELAPLADFLKAEAIENPGRLRERVGEIREYTQLKKDISELEGEIKKMGGPDNYEAALKKIAEDKADVEKNLGIVKWSTGWRGFLNPKNSELLGWAFRAREGADATGLRREMRKNSNWVANIFFTSEASKLYFAGLSRRIEELANKSDFLGGHTSRREYLNAQFSEMKKEIFTKFEPAKDLLKLASDKSIVELGRLIVSSGKDLAGLEKAQRRLEVLRSAKDVLGFEQLAEMPIEEFQKTIDDAMEEVVGEEILERVRKFDVRNKPLSKLKERLDDYLSREVLGSKNKKETREFVANLIKGEISYLVHGDPKEDGWKIKRAFLVAILDGLTKH